MIGALDEWVSQASAHAASVDWLTASFLLMATLLAAPVFILMAVFAVKFRRGRSANRTHSATGNTWLEVSWAVIPFLLTLVFFVWATKLYVDLQFPPTSALEIDVVAKQWMWKFQHPGGQREIDELHVPAGQPVKLVMASEDVIHSLYIPALRLKQDVVPGRYTALWFNAEKPGSYRLTCAEFCGTNHSAMGGRFVVMSPAEYARWLDAFGTDRTLAAAGAALFRERGCSGCHGAGSTVRAPSLAGLYGSPVPLDGGSVVIADDQFIRDSILLPQSQIAAGYPRIMPTFQNVLTEEDVLKLVAYIKSLSGGSQGEGRP